MYKNKKDIINKRNIILPIKPQYANKIINGEKKYEYRKRLCKESIGKIYIYATSPVKMIIGEAQVIKKITMNKESLWKISKEQAGISEKSFFEYFQKSVNGSAYYLGNAQKYKKPLSLKSIGIHYTPQSYVYIGEIFEEKL